MQDNNEGVIEFKKPKEKGCTLTDEELVKRVQEWVCKLSATGGKCWTLRVPVDFNYDPDMLILELANRYKNALGKLK